MDSPSAREFGCSEDFCIYSREILIPSISSNNRLAGGHFHIGYVKAETPEERKIEGERIIRDLDINLAIPSVVLDNTKYSDHRRKSYGRAGRFRPKYYGLEYRTLSNFWVADKILAKWAWDTIKRVVSGIDIATNIDPKLVRKVVNKSQTKKARKLIEE